MASTMVNFNGVVKTYGSGDAIQYAVNHVNFTIEEGEFVVILGQSGAGKSTVLNMLGGMDQPTSGEVIVDGDKVSGMNDRQLGEYRAKKIGFVFQFYNLIPSLTAYENIALTKSIVKDAMDPLELLKMVGLESCKDKFPSQMSGGEQQRVSIARALSKNPKIILGDEPTGALDSETGVIVLELLQKMCKEYGRTVILVTHNADIAQCADKVIRMKNGKIREIKVNEHPIPVKEVEW
ncbi:MAG: ABC transporter ATP-binding protein [Eubacteriales bacterium]|nr:ABC transporter ATP-binding protein [Eubacteriales bacterium]